MPPDWVAFSDEVRSHNGTLFTIEIHSLVDADPDFVKGLPESIIPQLEGRTRFYFSVVEEYRTVKTKVGGAPALEVHFPVRIRDIDPPSEVIYWIVPRGSRLFLLRATFPAGTIDADGPGALSIIDTWEFL